MAQTPLVRARTVYRVVLASSVLAPALAGAQEFEPRQYANIPTGLNFLVAGFSASDGNVLFDPTIQLENAELSTDGLLIGYARSLALGELSAKLDGALGRICLDGSAEYEGEPVTRDVCGITDAKMRLSVNFFGAPALTAREFASYRPDLIVGASIMLVAPVGDYDPARLVNIGTNRWSVKTEVGLSKTVDRWVFEAALAGTFFETNDDFFGGRTREQDAVYSVQGHIVRNFLSGAWVALDATYYRGGQTTLDGIGKADLQSNSRVGITLALPVNRRHSVKLNWSEGVSTRTGSDFTLLVAAWQYRWGGGL